MGEVQEGCGPVPRASGVHVMKVLVIFSNPPGHVPLRLDKEDRVFAQLAKDYDKAHTVERQHATEIDDVHTLVTKGNYDVIHFSGHGHQGGLYLDKSDFCSDEGELVSASLCLGWARSPRGRPTLGFG